MKTFSQVILSRIVDLVLGMNVLVAIYGKVILINFLCRIGFRIVYRDGPFLHTSEHIVNELIQLMKRLL